MGRPSRIRRILDWEIVSPSNRFVRPFSVLLDDRDRKYAPELARIGSLQERREVSHRAGLKLLGSGRFWFVLVVMLASGVAFDWFLTAITRAAPSFTLGIHSFIFAPACAVFGFIAAPRLLRGTYQRAVRLELCKRGIPICTECAYDLTGNLSGRCPECGEPAPRSSTTSKE